MAKNKKNINKPQVDVKVFAEKKQKDKSVVYRIVALAMAGLMLLGVVASAVVGILS